MRYVFYLHGFASSARSAKAAFLEERLRAHGLGLQCPDFNEPDFETMTITRMLEQVDASIAALPPGPVALIGSSLGGFVAYHTAYRHAAARGRARTTAHPIDRLVLLAPAFEFGRIPFGGMDEAGLAAWRETDRYEVFHHAENRPRAIRYAIYEDAQRYDSARCAVDTPALVFQGRLDTVVDPAMVQRFAAARPAMTVRMVDDDHQLGSSFDLMWREIAAFLGLCERAPGRGRH
jgi:pimeloyl-ACP methyl ester carboxylesterase